jgi:phenylacetate-coenzyme A ligase PaaK-like adenylate-forming protein
VPNNYIESWIHDIIRKEVGENEVGRSGVEAYQLRKLRTTLQYAYDNSSFYREHFDRAGVKPGRVSNLADLSAFPFTEPEHLAKAPYRFLCLSRAEIARPYSFVTSGTTGPRKRIFWTRGDIERITDFMAAGMGMVAGPGDVVQILLPDGRPDSQADLLRKGVLKLGATPVVADMEMSAEDQFLLMEESRSTVIFGYTGHIFRLSVELEAKHDLRASGVRVLFLAAEYLPEARRRELERLWDCRVHTHYGLTEMGLGVAVECEAKAGYHFNEAGLLLEVVHPRTGNPVKAGEEGELVFTTLNREAMPLIRYRTHDLSRLITEPCPCGAVTLLRIDKIRKRLESIIVLGSGDEMYPALFDDALFEIPGLIDYQVVLKRQGSRDYLDFKVELARERPDSLSVIKEKLLSTPLIAKNIKAGSMAEPSIELAPWGALQSTSRAKKMIVDRR